MPNRPPEERLFAPRSAPGTVSLKPGDGRGCVMSRWIRFVAWMAWIFVPLWAGLLLHWVTGDWWVVQESHRVFYWMVAAGAAWAAPFMVKGPTLPRELLCGGPLLPPLEKKWQMITALFALAVVSGLMGGRLLVEVLNCAADGSPGEVVTVEEVALVHQAVRFRVTSGGHAELTFVTGNATWRKYDPATVSLHRGRLGLYWCRFRSRRGP